MKNELPAINLLQDWSKWLVGINTAAIAAVGTFTDKVIKTDLVALNHRLFTFLIVSTLALFVLSLLSANMLLFALPGVAQRFDENSKDDIFLVGTFNGVGLTVLFFAMLQQHCFILAVIFSAALLLAGALKTGTTVFIVVAFFYFVFIARDFGTGLHENKLHK